MTIAVSVIAVRLQVVLSMTGDLKAPGLEGNVR
jgi:hypothetical protein